MNDQPYNPPMQSEPVEEGMPLWEQPLADEAKTRRDVSLNPGVYIRNQLEQIRNNLLVIVAPGDKQFKDLPKRLRLMLVSVFVPLFLFMAKVFLFEGNPSIVLWLVLSAALGFLTYIGLIWALKFQLKEESYVTVLPMVSLFVFVYSLFTSVMFMGLLDRVYLVLAFILVIGLFMLFLYMGALSANVLNVNFFSSIPLAKLAESLVYLISVSIIFFSTFSFTTVALRVMLESNWLLFWLILILAFLVTFILMMTIALYYMPKDRETWQLICWNASIVTVVSAFLNLFIPYTWLNAAIMTLLTYVLLGVIIHRKQNTLSRVVIVEYVAIFVAIFACILLV